MKNIAILGSTGSIGRSTLEVVEHLKDRFSVLALSANSNTTLLAEQAARFRPNLVVLGESSLIAQLKEHIPSGIEILAGVEGLMEISSYPEVELVVNAVVGVAGALPTLEAIRAKKGVAMANKEALVGFGGILMGEARRLGVEIIPIDSEHSAIHQCLHKRDRGELRRLFLTASGGPFQGRSSLADVSPEEALSHPTWNMGEKVTVDSATLMNKGLEVIEAHQLFGIEPDKIEVLIHPQSVVHSLVEFRDSSLIAQLAPPDMKLPIQYALTYPERCESLVGPLDLAEVGALEFSEPDLEKFPCLKLAYFAVQGGGTYPAVLSAADEVAVRGFLDEKISFTDIARVVEATLEAHQVVSHPSIEETLEADRWARDFTRKLCEVI